MENLLVYRWRAHGAVKVEILVLSWKDTVRGYRSWKEAVEIRAPNDLTRSTNIGHRNASRSRDVSDQASDGEDIQYEFQITSFSTLHHIIIVLFNPLCLAHNVYAEENINILIRYVILRWRLGI